MTKAEFLKHLEKSLHVLNEKERLDILSEYTQHIDFKMESNGLSEEAAIKDFGNIDELACEILDAYNVDPNYKKMTIPEIHFNWKKLWTDTSNAFKHMGDKMKNIGHSIKAWWNKIAEKLNSMTKSEWIKPASKKTVAEPKKKEEKPKMEIKAGMQQFGDCMKQTLYFIWKLYITVFLLPIILMGFLLIVGLGIVVVLAFMGYPVIGFTLITIGLLLCTTAVVWLTGRYLTKKRVV